MPIFFFSSIFKPRRSYGLKSILVVDANPFNGDMDCDIECDIDCDIQCDIQFGIDYDNQSHRSGFPHERAS